MQHTHNLALPCADGVLHAAAAAGKAAYSHGVAQNGCAHDTNEHVSCSAIAQVIISFTDGSRQHDMCRLVFHHSNAQSYERSDHGLVQSAGCVTPKLAISKSKRQTLKLTNSHSKASSSHNHMRMHDAHKQQSRSPRTLVKC